MTQVSRPLLALLAGTVLLFAVWLVALRGGSPTTVPTRPATEHTATTPNAHPATARAALAPSATPASRTAVVHRGWAAAHRLNAVERALAQNKVIALLFYNPAAADDRAVKRELSTVPIHGGRVVKLTVPLSELGSYTVVTNQVLVGTSPTLVLIDRHHQASTVVGFADRFEIAGRVADALATS